MNRLLPAAIVLCAGLCSCTPWTVRPIGGNSASSETETGLSPVARADSLWSTKIVPSIEASATDAQVLLDAMQNSLDAAGQKYGHREGSGAWNFAVKGVGKVVSADTKSRHGVLTIDLGGRRRALIQIGPAVRGTALRDVTGQIRFTDFVNQLQFADVANELNARALKDVVAPFGLDGIQGRSIRFTGAFSAGAADVASVDDVVPVQLEIQTKDVRP